MHLIRNNSIRALRFPGFAALSAVILLAAAFTPAKAGTCTTFTFAMANGASTMWMIDATTHKVVAQIPKGGPRLSVVTPNGETRYYVNTKENVVSYVNKCENGHPTHTVCVGTGPYGLALSFDAKKLFVFSRIAETISVIDTRDNRVVEVDPAPADHFGIKVTEDGYLTAVR